MTLWTPGVGVVRLPDGRLVRGSGLRRVRRWTVKPDFAVYLLDRDPQVTEWPNRWVRWRDFRVPDSLEGAVAALREAHRRSAFERVAILCGGGVGRTGTAIAVLAVLSGVAPDAAVDWTRAHYHRRAVETRAQRSWVKTVGSSLSSGFPRSPD